MWKSLAKEMEKYSELNELKEDIDEDVEEGFKDKFEDDECQIFVVERDNILVGYIMIEFRENETRINDSSLKISELYIDNNYRNQGLGTQLIKKVEKLAKKEDVDYIRINSEWGNEGARSLYEELGFKPKKIGYSKTI